MELALRTDSLRQREKRLGREESPLKGITANLAGWINAKEGKKKNQTKKTKQINKTTKKPHPKTDRATKRWALEVRNTSYQSESELANKKFIIRTERKRRTWENHY